MIEDTDINDMISLCHTSTAVGFCILMLKLSDVPSMLRNRAPWRAGDTRHTGDSACTRVVGSSFLNIFAGYTTTMHTNSHMCAAKPQIHTNQAWLEFSSRGRVCFLTLLAGRKCKLRGLGNCSEQFVGCSWSRMLPYKVPVVFFIKNQVSFFSLQILWLQGPQVAGKPWRTMPPPKSDSDRPRGAAVSTCALDCDETFDTFDTCYLVQNEAEALKVKNQTMSRA